MKIHQLFHQLTEKFVPMDEQTRSELSVKAGNAYGKVLEEIEDIERHNNDVDAYNSANKDAKDFVPETYMPFKLKHKVVKFLEQWYMRYIMAILFVILVPKIKGYMNGEKDEPVHRIKKKEKKKGFFDFLSSKSDEDEDLYEDEDEDIDEDEYREFLKWKKSYA